MVDAALPVRAVVLTTISPKLIQAMTVGAAPNIGKVQQKAEKSAKGGREGSG
jgi:hypothetical protein